jgi:DNA invertase Pin-like site-specific DNA recombinase
MNNEEKPQKKRTNCAIYTRKSTSEGLDQNFTSLDAQRESAENYINSQKHEGWGVLRERYNDGGFTGANTERPALQNLMKDIKDGQIDCVVVYKVDRLSRSLLDFTQLLEFFDKNNVAFVSVTQQFNTNTSMGRLTLNILLSFAQFEREIISERTKDKIGAARRRGQWIGGVTPLGYEVKKDTKQMSIIEEEAQMVRDIFDLYLQEGNTLTAVVGIINERGWRTKSRITKKGVESGAKKFRNSHVQHYLNNIVYTGKVAYAGQTYDGQQPPIISEETFFKVQQKLAENRTTRKATKNFECSGILKYLLKCKSCGCAMTHTYTVNRKNPGYRYYICINASQHRYLACPNKSINANVIENEVLGVIRKAFPITSERGHDNEINAILSPTWNRLPHDEKHKTLKQLLKEVDCDIREGKIGITLNSSNQRLEFDVAIKKSQTRSAWRKDREIIKEPRILRSLLLAHQLQQLMDDGKLESLKQASGWLHISQSRLSHILSLLLLSPAIQTEIVVGDPQKIDSIPEYQVLSVAAECNWNAQTQLWREIKHSVSER